MDVSQMLKEDRRKTAKLHSLTDITRDDPPTVDTGNLLCLDARPLEADQISDASYLNSLVRENTQLLFNEIWGLPVTKDVDGVFAKLPAGATRQPREKPLPEDRPKTRFEKYAEMKGIQKRKESRMVYDEDTDKYVPRWGYGKKDVVAQRGYIELSDQQDPYIDAFAKLKEDKEKRIGKNKNQNLRNTAAARLYNDGQTVTKSAIKNKLKQDFRVSRVATASHGVFDKSLPNEPKMRTKGSKRQRDSAVGDLKSERKKALAVAKKLAKGVHISTATGVAPTIAKAVDMGPKKQTKFNRKKGGHNKKTD